MRGGVNGTGGMKQGRKTEREVGRRTAGNERAGRCIKRDRTA